jgi:hypothetical protein
MKKFAVKQEEFAPRPPTVIVPPPTQCHRRRAPVYPGAME